MTPRILCAHDLTGASDPALRTALDLARRLGAEVTVFSAAALPWPTAAGLGFVLAPNLQGLPAQIREAARAELDARVKTCTRPGDPPVSLAVELREPGEGILAAVKSMSPALVVLGTHARTGWQHLRLGSVAERIARESAVPVLTVRPNIAAGNVGSAPRAPIVCATDLTETSRPALEQALRLASALETELCVLHVSAPLFPDPSYRSLAVQEALALHGTGALGRRQAEAVLEDFVQGAKTSVGLAGGSTRTRVVEGLAAETIVGQARAAGARLIVMGTRGRTGLPHLLLGSVAERVMRTADRPVLTVGPRAVAACLNEAPSTRGRSSA